MAMSVGPRSSKKGFRPVSDINVTPLVDVMLVLLIVFMVTAPLMNVGVPLDLPESSAAPLPEEKEPLTVSIDGQGRIFLQETEVQQDTLIPRLKAITGANPEARIFVRGDKTLPYGRIMEVMGFINSAGFQKVALVAEAAQGGLKAGTIQKKP